MKKYIIRDANKEAKLKSDKKIIAGIMFTEDEKIVNFKGWKSIKEIVSLKSIDKISGDKKEDMFFTDIEKLNSGDKGFIDAIVDELTKLEFLVEEVKK